MAIDGGGNRGRASLTVRKLALARRDRFLFRNVSFELNAGELLFVQGPNGAGKTSLLRILAGLTLPTRGAVSWNGKPIAGIRAQYGQELLYVGHRAGLKGGLTPVEDLRAFCRLRGQDGKEVEQPLATIGLSTHLDTPCRMLSAGQERRAALARLLAVPALLWILDEPYTALDRDAAGHVDELIADHLKAGGAAVVTSHQPLGRTFPNLRRLELGHG